MKWIEVPKHRLLIVSRQEYVSQFFVQDAEGKQIDHFDAHGIHRIYRRSDMMMFVAPKYVPMWDDYKEFIAIEPYYG